jgi:hypothetical protein
MKPVLLLLLPLQQLHRQQAVAKRERVVEASICD